MFRLKAPTAKLSNPTFKPPSKHRTSLYPSPSTSQTPFMDPSIWSKLPREILDLILSFLPLNTFLSLRSTCKHFKSLIFSPDFVSKHSSPTLSSFLLLSHPQCGPDFPLYDPRLGSWRTLAIPCSDSLTCASERRSLLSTSNGLLCFSVHGSGSSILVVNLLTGSSRSIESPIYPLDVKHFALVADAWGYRIFALCSGSSVRRAYVYRSGDRCWTRFDGPDPILARDFYQDGVFHNGSLYFTAPEPFAIVSFDLDSGKWTNRVEENRRGLPQDLTFGRLASDSENSKLFLVGGIGQNGISRSIKLWELHKDTETDTWIEVEDLPDAFCRKLMSVCYHNYEHLYCVWHKGLVCVCCYTWPEILCYKASWRTWHWLPKCPSLPEKWSCGFRWFSFVPQLYVSA